MTTPTTTGFLSRGYFPKELPPAFNTRLLSRISRNRSSLPPEFLNPTKSTHTAIHSYLARINSRRNLGIPNPVSFYALANCIVTNWNSISSKTKSRISLTTPKYLGPPGRAVGTKQEFNMLSDHKAMVRSHSRHILIADISQFYHSIYTHSIAWAIHTKPYAKSHRRDMTLLGNKLDKFIRSGQDDQTIGIPIGPDTSMVIAEMILSSCDSELNNLKITNAFRWVDDYEFGCHTISEAERVRDQLHEIVSSYELTLNPDKTKILDLPLPLESSCISFIRTAELAGETDPKRQRYTLIHLFDVVFTELKKDKDVSILKYLLGRLGNLIVAKDNWTLFENILLQCVATDPSTLQAAFNQLLWYKDNGYNVNYDQLQDVMYSIIKTHAPINHGSEVAWAIWILIVFKRNLGEPEAKAAGNMSDSIVSILLLDAFSKGLLPVGFVFPYFQAAMTTDELYGERWLLSYEANVNNWLPSNGVPDHVQVDSSFGYLKSLAIKFYDTDWDKNRVINLKATQPSPGGGGGGGGTY